MRLYEIIVISVLVVGVIAAVVFTVQHPGEAKIWVDILGIVGEILGAFN